MITPRFLMTERTTATQSAGISHLRLTLAFVGALAFVYLRAFRWNGVPFVASGDQMLFFSRGLRVMHGQAMYRDVFDFLPPGIHLLNALVFRLAGVHAWVMPAMAVAVQLTFCCMLTRIAGKIVPGTLALLPGLLFLVFAFANAPELTHHWYSTLAVLAVVSVLMDGISLRHIGLASALCGIATLFTQTAGVMALLAVGIYLLWLAPRQSSYWRIAVALVLPWMVIVCGVLGYYVYQAGFKTMFFDLVLFAPRFLTGGPNSSRTYLRQFPGFHGVGDAFRNTPFVVIYALVPYAYIAGLIKLRRRGNKLDPVLRERLVLLSVVGLGLFFSIITGLRFFRICTVAPLALVMCAWLVSAPGRWERMARTGLWVVAGIFAIMLPLHRQREWHATLNLSVGRVAFTDPFVWQRFQWVAQRTHPGDAFFDADGSALGLYLKLRNPTLVEYLTDQEPSARENAAEVVASLERDPPQYVGLLQDDHRTTDGRSGLLLAYLQQHYRVAYTSRFQSDVKAEEEIWEIVPTLPLPSPLTAPQPPSPSPTP
jgi:hypothetical protein